MLIQRLHDGVNRARKTITANFICVELAFVGADYSLLADLTGGQAAQSGNGIIKSCSMAFEHIIPDSPSFFSEGVYLGVKVIPAFHVIGAFCPRTKSAHKTPEGVYAGLPGAFASVFSIPSVAANGEEMTEKRSHESAA
jgi:hypothetical protein